MVMKCIFTKFGDPQPETFQLKKNSGMHEAFQNDTTRQIQQNLFVFFVSLLNLEILSLKH